ncbi:WHG domain-containing protein [Nonomuraea sp. NPDC049684]|uniref:TetR-like C-terminal domain-containing protein n=1 Tax=Nonomuraea sp. NPDC049684 TaxID=3364356 RepID=UPI003799DE3A
MTLSTRVAIVTGPSSGIGAATARLLAAQGALHSTFHGYVTLETAGGFGRTEREVDAYWSRGLHALLRQWSAL